MAIRGRALLRSIGPFWPDMTDDDRWGIECQRKDGKHFLAVLEPTSCGDTDAELASAIADALNSACGFPKGSR